MTLLFTDLVGSTELLDELGDDEAERLRRVHFGLLRDVALSHAGQEVKNLGDGLMVAFASSVDAAALRGRRSSRPSTATTGAPGTSGCASASG